jgi:hypothetical protein
MKTAQVEALRSYDGGVEQSLVTATDSVSILEMHESELVAVVL